MRQRNVPCCAWQIEPGHDVRAGRTPLSRPISISTLSSRKAIQLRTAVDILLCTTTTKTTDEHCDDGAGEEEEPILERHHADEENSRKK